MIFLVRFGLKSKNNLIFVKIKFVVFFKLNVVIKINCL